ncbi:hypothetical protein Tco_0643559 [Tanacetum coccineum]
MLTPTIHTLPNRKPVVQLYMQLSPFRDKAIVTREEEQDDDIPLQDGVMQPLTPQTAHITPPDNVALATRPILDKLLNEFGEDFYDITRAAKKADGNPVNDVKDLSDIIKTCDFETFIRKLLHQDLNSKEIEFEIILTRNRVEENEHLSKKHEIWTPKQAKLDFQDLLRRNHLAGVTP